MSRSTKHEAMQGKSRKKSSTGQITTEEGADEKKLGRLVDADTAASVEVQLGNKSKKEEKERRKDKKRKLGANVENSSAEDYKRVKTLKIPTVTPITMPSPPPIEDEPSRKKSRKSKKRKGTDDEAVEAVPLEGIEGNSKKEKLSKKAKMTVKGIPAAQNEAATACGRALDDIPTPILEHEFITLEDARARRDREVESKKHEKMSKKEKRRAATAGELEGESAQEANGNGATQQQPPIGETTEIASNAKKPRFVVFIGNLPFTATKEDIQKHLEKIKPTDVRVTTDKRTKKSKGFAFVEFDRFDRMETCLKKYQHSIIGEGKEARKINVELTAGGGGNTEFRKTKIQAKNNKLHEERLREREKREELETKQQDRKQKKEARQSVGTKQASSLASQPDAPVEEISSMHPARFAMMNKPATPGKLYSRTRY